MHSHTFRPSIVARPPVSRDAPPLEVRRATDADLPAVVGLLTESLGWASDERHEALFRWKHEENPAGPSPAWVATDDDRLAGFRVLMRWEFARGAETLAAVRAVDTATHSDYRGRGIFTLLTRRGVEDMTRDGVDFVFNTPNDQSKPGYLKMGWEPVGALRVAMRPTGLRGAWAALRSRTPARLWSEPSTMGESAPDVLASADLDALLASQPASGAVHTRLTGAYLRWRFGTPLLAYRCVIDPRGPEEGVAFLRVRRRGPAREAALCEVVVPGGESARRAALGRRAVRAADADYVVALGRGVQGCPAPRALGGFVPLPGQGPLLTWRALARAEKPDRWDLTLGDIELF